MQFWFDTWPVRYNVLWSLTDILLGFCGSSGCFFGDSQSFFFKRKVNSFHFNVMKINHVIDDFLKKCPDTWNCLIFVSSMKLSVCNRFISFRVTIITLFILRCQGFIFVLRNFIISFSMQSLVQFTITNFWFGNVFIRITFFIRTAFAKFNCIF